LLQATYPIASITNYTNPVVKNYRKKFKKIVQPFQAIF